MADKEDVRTWGQRYLDRGEIPPTVELEAGEYLISAMRDMGPVTSNGWGPMARPDDQILAYFSGVGFELEAWEFSAVRQMCRAYLAGLRSGADKFSIPPMERRG